MRRSSGRPRAVEVEFGRAAVRRGFLFVEVDAEGDEFADARRTVADDGAHGRLVAQPRPGFEGVFTWNSKESSLLHTQATPPCAQAVLESAGRALGDDGDLAVRGGLQRETSARRRRCRSRRNRNFS